MRKRRTREHIIADLSRHHVEGFVLRCGFVIETLTKDYGYDLALNTFDPNGEREAGVIWFQLKATDHLRTRQRDGAIVHSVEIRDLQLWCREEIPVILIVYDAQSDRAYWCHLQEQFSLGSLPSNQTTLTVAIPATNVLSEDTIQEFRRLKNEALR
jgi:hypothetical protein